MKKIVNSTLAVIFFVATALCLTSCDREKIIDVNQDRIYAEYELYYDKNENKTYASAVFKLGDVLGTQVQLTDPSEVTFNGDVIPFAPVFAYYRKEYPGLVGSGTFIFKDLNGKSYTNTVKMVDAISNPTIDTIKKSLGTYTYNWVGGKLKANESAGLTINHIANPVIFQFFQQETVGTNNFTLYSLQLNLLLSGINNCQFDKKIEYPATGVTSAGGKIRSKYKALNKSVYIK